MKGATKYRTTASLALLSSLILLNTSCSNSLFKVKPVSELPALPNAAASANVGTLTFRAAPLLTDEETQELFESNLQLAGLLPVRVEIIHNSGDVFELKKLRFHLHDGAGGDWKMISAKQAISRILKANGVFAYNPNSRKTFEKEFRAYELDLKTPLTHAEGKRQGLVIFQTARKDPVASPRELVLTVEGLAQPVSLKLN
jgi:hypothetical protein